MKSCIELVHSTAMLPNELTMQWCILCHQHSAERIVPENACEAVMINDAKIMVIGGVHSNYNTQFTSPESTQHNSVHSEAEQP